MDYFTDRFLGQPSTPKELQRMLDKARQAQHEATWAMAMEEVKDRYSLGEGYSLNKGDSWSPDKAFRDELQYNFPCPPLQTNNGGGE